MDFGSLMSMMGPPPAMMTRPGRSAETESVSDIVSIDDGAGDPDTREVEFAGEKKKRGPKQKKREVTL
jgi:hypothetical protein